MGVKWTDLVLLSFLLITKLPTDISMLNLYNEILVGSIIIEVQSQHHHIYPFCPRSGLKFVRTDSAPAVVKLVNNSIKVNNLQFIPNHPWI